MMNHDLLLANIAKHTQLNDEETAQFTSLLSLKKLSKKDFFLEEGQPCHHLAFVHSGALRAYHLDAAGKESTIMFALTDWWITDMYCFLNQKPAMVFIEALEDSEIFLLSKENLDRLFDTMPKFERFFRILMQNAYTREQLRIIENLSLPAAKRYDNFLAKYPQIINQVTQKQIASYLGITPEFLSTIRKNKARGTIS